MQLSDWTQYEIGTVLDSSLEATGNRTGFHLGQVLDRVSKSLGEEYAPSDPTNRFAAGFVWETAVEYMSRGMTLDDAMDAAFRRYMLAIDKNVQTQLPLERDGIRCTPDAFNKEIGEVISFKNTWRKMPGSADEFQEKFWRWCWQECSYAYLLGVDTARWIVLWNNGNYKDIRGPVVMQATAVWTPEELTQNWRAILNVAKKMPEYVEDVGEFPPARGYTE